MVVDLPKDIMNPAIKLPYSYPENVKMRSYSPTLQGHRGQIKRALQTLLAAKQPIIYAGGGVISSGCHEELRQLAERLNIPVTTSLMGLGGFPASHAQSLGMLGMHGTYEANMAMHNADVILPSVCVSTIVPPTIWQSTVPMRQCYISISILPQSPNR